MRTTVNTNAKKITAAIAVLLLLLAGGVGGLLSAAYADNAEDTPVLYINEQSTEISSFSFENALQIGYGEIADFSVSSGAVQNYLALNAQGADTANLESASWQTLTSGERLTLVPGNYFLGFSAVVDYQDVDYLSGDYGITVVKGTLAVPSSVSWSNKTASWSAVSSSAGGSALDSGALGGYSVTLYKDGNAITTLNTSSSVTTYDFSSLINANGAGSYSFTVQATVAGGFSSLYNSSAASAAASSRAVSVSLSAGSGIASFSPSSASTVMCGQSLTVSAVLESGRTFENWTCAQSGISFASASSASTTVYISSSYSGSDSVTVTAAAVDPYAPVISAFSASAQNTKLTATASDADRGIAFYSFSTEPDADDAEWTAASAGAGEALTVYFSLTDSGTYYFHVKDTVGNTATSTALNVTQVRYHDYYANSAPAELTEYMIGSASLSIKAPVRAGFTYSGWYTNESLSGSSVSTISQHSTAGGIDVYTAWEREEVSFSSQPSALSFTYDGVYHQLSAAVSNTSGVITWQWYKDGQAIPGAKYSTYSVSAVADSGEYYVKATVTAEGVGISCSSNAVSVSITPAVLTITPVNITITYADAVPPLHLRVQRLGTRRNPGVRHHGDGRLRVFSGQQCR